jgi:beta-glucosidase
MLKQNIRVLLASALFILVAPANAEWDEKKMAEKIDGLVSQMTLEEKASMTSGRDAWSTQPIERLDIPFIWMADGPHGLRRAPTTYLWGYGDQAPCNLFSQQPRHYLQPGIWTLLEEVGSALGAGV